LAISPGEKQDSFSSAHGLVEAFVLTHSGNVGLSQNLDVLQDAAAELHLYPDILIAIIGDRLKRKAPGSRAKQFSCEEAARKLPAVFDEVIVTAGNGWQS
jgi:hypothetical protein